MLVKNGSLSLEKELLFFFFFFFRAVVKIHAAATRTRQTDRASARFRFLDTQTVRYDTTTTCLDMLCRHFLDCLFGMDTRALNVLYCSGKTPQEDAGCIFRQTVLERLLSTCAAFWIKVFHDLSCCDFCLFVHLFCKTKDREEEEARE